MTYVEELEHIAEVNGGLLRPKDVVSFAADPETALHGKFTWDDEEAGHNYRLWQARTLIRCTVIMLPKAKKEYRAFVSMKSDRMNPGGGYRSTVSVLARKSSRNDLLKQALEELEAFKARYKELKELADVFDAIRRVRSSV